jgi:hypothetical protein
MNDRRPSLPSIRSIFGIADNGETSVSSDLLGPHIWVSRLTNFSISLPRYVHRTSGYVTAQAPICELRRGTGQGLLQPPTPIGLNVRRVFATARLFKVPLFGHASIRIVTGPGFGRLRIRRRDGTFFGSRGRGSKRGEVLTRDGQEDERSRLVDEVEPDPVHDRRAREHRRWSSAKDATSSGLSRIFSPASSPPSTRPP